MPKFVRRFIAAVLIVSGTLLVVTAGLQYAVNHHAADRLIRRLCSSYMDVKPEWSDLNVRILRHFPVVSVSLDDVSFTYPHDRFPERVNSTASGFFFDLGRGESSDTLLSVSHLSASLDIFELCGGKIKLGDIAIDGIRAFAHRYDTLANWDVFRTPCRKAPDSLRGGAPVPPIYLGKVNVTRGPFLAFTSGNLAACAELDLKLRYADLSSLPEVSCGVDAGVPSFKLDLEGVRASGSASVTFDMDSLGMRAGLLVPELPLDGTLRSLAAMYVPGFASLRAGSSLHLDLSGTYGKDGVADISLKNMNLSADGLEISADGKVSDFLGKDPSVMLGLRGDVVLDSLGRYVPDSLGMEASGKTGFTIKADSRLSELKSLSFRNSDFQCRVSGKKFSLASRRDSLSADVDNLLFALHSGPKGLKLEAGVDSLLVGGGKRMLVKGRGLRTGGLVRLVEYRGRKVPCVSASVLGRGLFLKYDRNKMGFKEIRMEASAKRRIRKTGASPADSLHRPAPVPVDTALVNLWNRWKPEFAFSAGKVFVATPALPLRTRVNGVGMRFSDNDITIDSLKAACGVSDLDVTGSLKNLRRALRHRAALDLDLDVKSASFNLNEILNALEYAGKTEVKVSEVENDESFVVDSLSGNNASKSSLSLLMLPDGFTGDIRLNAGNLQLFNISATEGSALISFRDRCMQVSDARLCTNYGDIACTIFYRTPGDRYSSVGLDLKLSDIDAGGIIHLVPAIDRMMPALQSFKGRLGCEISATSRMGTDMFLDLPSLEGIVRISGNDLRIDDAGDLKKITRLLLFRNKNIGHIDDMKVDAVVHDNKLEVFPFVLGVDRYRIAMSGVQGFDQSMDYHVSILKSPLPFRIGINISGEKGRWRYSLCRPRYKSDRVPVFTRQLDEMQLEIGSAIKNILKTAASESAGQGGRAVRSFKKKTGVTKEALLSSSEFLSAEEFIKMDSLQFVEEIRGSDDELQADMDAVMSETFQSASKLMKEYEAELATSKKSRRTGK